MYTKNYMHFGVLFIAYPCSIFKEIVIEIIEERKVHFKSWSHIEDLIKLP